MSKTVTKMKEAIIQSIQVLFFMTKLISDKYFRTNIIRDEMTKTSTKMKRGYYTVYTHDLFIMTEIFSDKMTNSTSGRTSSGMR
jgi:hypothetical protein